MSAQINELSEEIKTILPLFRWAVHNEANRPEDERPMWQTRVEFHHQQLLDALREQFGSKLSAGDLKHLV